MSTLNSRLQLSILNRKKSHNLIQKGFTLVELMIVIVVVGILSAVALPQFLGVRDRAELGSNIGAQVGLAKECASAIIIGLANLPANCTTATGYTFTSAAATANSAGVACGPLAADELAVGETCTIAVTPAGAITYTVAS